MTWAPDYATRAEVKLYLDLDETTNRDAFIDTWITTVSRNVDDHTGRQFGLVDGPEERFYTGTYDRSEMAIFADIDDLQDITGLVVKNSSGTTITDYTLLQRNALLKGKPYTQIKVPAGSGELSITARWGWATVPASVKTGLLLQAARLNARMDSPFGLAGSPNDGTVVQLYASLDPDFKTSLKPYVRKWWIR